MVKFLFNSIGNAEKPTFFLCNVDKSRICVLNTTDENVEVSDTDIATISFTILAENNINIDLIKAPKLIEVSGEYFMITSPDTTIDANTTKIEIECKKSEYELASKFLYDFYINDPDNEELTYTKVTLYDESKPSQSLLSLVLDKVPNWSVGHIDTQLLNQCQKTFSEDSIDVYSFLMEEVAKAYDAVIIFDTKDNTINMYSKETYGEYTNVFVSFDNLLKEVKVNYDVDDIVTQLKVKGGDDDITIRNINCGSDTITNLTYFETEEFMGATTLSRWNDYKEYVASQNTIYVGYVASQDGIHALRDPLITNYPDNFDTDTNYTDTTKWGQTALKAKMDLAKIEKDTLIEYAKEDTTSDDYKEYIKYYNMYYSVKAAYNSITKRIKTYDAQLEALETKKTNVLVSVNMQTYFTVTNDWVDDYKKICFFIRQDDFTDDTLCFTDLDDEESKLEKEQSLLESANKELNKVCYPTLKWDMTMKNIFALESFSNVLNNFSIYNYITIGIRDSLIVKGYISKISINLSQKDSLSVEFSNIIGVHDTIDWLAKQAANGANAAATINGNIAKWDASSSKVDNVYDRIANGLDLALTRVMSSGNQAIEIDDGGLWARKYSDDTKENFEDEQFVLTNNVLLFTTDDWKTAETGLGKFEVEKYAFNADESLPWDGLTKETVETYGLLAQLVMAGYIEGSQIIGSNIVGGKIASKNYKYTDSSETELLKGTVIDLEKGTFLSKNAKLDENGNISIKGIIEAASGSKLGEWSITDSKIESPDKTLVLNATTSEVATYTNDIKRSRLNKTGIDLYGSDGKYLGHYGSSDLYAVDENGDSTGIILGDIMSVAVEDDCLGWGVTAVVPGSGIELKQRRIWYDRENDSFDVRCNGKFDSVTIGKGDDQFTLSSTFSDSLVGRKTSDGGEIFNDYNNNKAASFAHAEGRDSIASGDFSHAEGYCTTASNYGSHASGYYSLAKGYQSFAHGYECKAEGDYSFALGYECYSTYSAFSMGNYSTASGKYSFSLGRETLSSGYSSFASGWYSTASSDCSHVEGNQNLASGAAAHAEGCATTASGYNSHAEGYDTIANNDESHAEGYGTTASGTHSHAEGSNTLAYGTESHAEGSNTKALSGYAHAEGCSTTASGNSSHAEGYGAVASCWAAHAEGDCSTATGSGSGHAEGCRTFCYGYASHSEGYCATAGGSYTHTEGDNTISNGQASHSEGEMTNSSGRATHAEGYCTTATNMGSHSEGNYSGALASGSHSGGCGIYGYPTMANGDGSFSHGCGIITNGKNEVAFGQYNTFGTTNSDGYTEYLFTIGNGTGTTYTDEDNNVKYETHNAFSILREGGLVVNDENNNNHTLLINDEGIIVDDVNILESLKEQISTYSDTSSIATTVASNSEAIADIERRLAILENLINPPEE